MRKINGVFLGGPKPDPSSKYGLNRRQFDADMESNLSRRDAKRQKAREALREVITADTDYQGNYYTLITVLKEIKEEMEL